MIDVIKIDGCADDEQEDSEMHVTDQSITSHEKVGLMGAIGKEGADPCLLFWTVPRVPDDFDVSTCPILLRCRHDSTGKTDKQAQEPEGVHPDSISGRREMGRSRKDGRVRNIRVGEELIDAREIDR